MVPSKKILFYFATYIIIAFRKEEVNESTRRRENNIFVLNEYDLIILNETETI
jgi:hypothetical protein